MNNCKASCFNKKQNFKRSEQDHSYFRVLGTWGSKLGPKHPNSYEPASPSALSCRRMWVGPDQSRRGRCLPEEGRCRVPPRRRQHCDPEAPPWRQSLSVTRRRCELPRAVTLSNTGRTGSTEFHEVNCSANQGHTQNMINAARKRRSLVKASLGVIFHSPYLRA